MPDELLMLLRLVAVWVQGNPAQRFATLAYVIIGGAFLYGVFIGWALTLALRG